MGLTDWFSVILLSAGCFFYLAGTIGLLRLPDVHARLHALTKADNVGLGLVVFGLAVQSGSVFVILKLLLTWLFLMYSGSLASYIVAQMVYRRTKEGDST